MKTEANKSGGQCPECKQSILLVPAKVGQFLTCPHCDVELEVTGIDPLEFEWAYDWMWEEEDPEEEVKSKPTGGTKVMALAFCPDCDGEIRFNPHANFGQMLSCPHCEVDLEVISVDPPVLDLVFVGDEDTEWGQDEDEDDW